MPDPAPPRVFISYSHDSEPHRARVLALADRLRDDGVETWIDQYVASPPNGWPAWCEEQIDAAGFVVMVCAETYLEKTKPNAAPSGVLWEAQLIRQHLYRVGTISNKFVPVLFDDGSDAHVPIMVAGRTIHRVDTDDGYEALHRLLTGQHATPAPPSEPQLMQRPMASYFRPCISSQVTIVVRHARRSAWVSVPARADHGR